MPPFVTLQRYLWLGIFLLTAGMVWFSAWLSWHSGIVELRAQSAQRLNRFVSHLDGQLARYDFIPQLLAGHTQIKELLRDPDNPARVDLLNHYLEEVNTIIGAADTYVMSTTGLTLAASNWQLERTFVGRNFSFRPYFRQAMRGGRGHYFALGTTSGQRGYYFAHPVEHAADLIGVVVVKMNLSDIEARWSERDDQFIVTDENGIVFISTRPDWRFSAIRPLDAATRSDIARSRRYPGITFATLPMQPRDLLAGGARVVHVGRSPGGRYLSLEFPMPDAGWVVHILSPTGGVRGQALGTAVVVLLAMLLLGAVFALYMQRAQRRREREQFTARVQHELETRVDERTRELTHEIEERKRTEQTLRATRDELVQAGKLAVLGELSASISHELNNPLAAIRSYADNARQFLARRQLDPVDGNLDHIVRLTDRMARISSQLKVFARKSDGQLDTVGVRKVVRDALDIVRPQAKRAGVALECKCGDDSLQVRADAIQLEQVLVNLVANALHALGGVADGKVTVTAVGGDDVSLRVDDNGPGIDPDHRMRIFEPFFTTRAAGLGLGLSISRRIIEGMRGRLEAGSAPGGGARFEIRLPREVA